MADYQVPLFANFVKLRVNAVTLVAFNAQLSLDCILLVCYKGLVIEVDLAAIVCILDDCEMRTITTGQIVEDHTAASSGIDCSKSFEVSNAGLVCNLLR